MINLEVNSEEKNGNVNTRVSTDINGAKFIVTREVSLAVKELVKYSLKLGNAEHLYVMTELLNALDELRNKGIVLGDEDDEQ